MSVAEFPPRVTQVPADVAPAVERPRRFALTLEHCIYIGLFALAVLSRLWGLEDRALHHDETLHAYYSWQLFMGRGFTHDPLLHGPFLYHLGALIYFLFGDNDYTARLGVALFGSVLVVLPYLIRRELGRGAALAAASYLLFSPAFLYVSRFIRHDMYAVTFELLTFISIVRYASTRQARWLYVGAASLGLMFTTMETFFLYVAIFGTLLALVFLWRVWGPGIVLASAFGLAVVALVFVLPGEPQRRLAGDDAVDRALGAYVCPSPGTPSPPDNPIIAEPGPVFGLPPLATADNDYALCVRHQPDNNIVLYVIKLWQFFRHPAILAAIALSIAVLGSLYWLIWRQPGADGKTPWQRAHEAGDGTVLAFASLAHGRRVAVALAIFGVIYALFFTAFFTNPAGVISGTTGSLLYWLAQHGVQRGGQPQHYYLVLLAIYEPLALLWSAVGLVMAVVIVARQLLRRAVAVTPTINWPVVMPLLLAWWSIATLGLYSWAGEKMPWLTIHVALPLVLLGAWACGQTLAWWHRSRLEAGAAIPLASVAASDSTGQTGDWNSDADGSLNGNEREPAADVQATGAWRLDRALLVYLSIFAAVTGLCFLLLTTFGKPNGSMESYTPFVPLLGLVLVTVLSLGAGLLRGARWTIGALVIGVSLLAALYGMRSGFQISYRWGDVPREMLIYTQTSPDVARVIRRLEEASTRRGGGLDMVVWYDNETVWQWYLRRFSNAKQQSPALTTPPDDKVMAVLMLQQNLDTYPQNLQSLQGFRIQRFPLRWWFPEDQTYRLPANWRSAPMNEQSSLLMRVLRQPTDARTAAELWQYLIYRQLPAPIGSTDFVIAVRPELADEIGLGTGATNEP